MKYEGSCHCGQIRFEVEGEIGQAMSCNCSICQRKGALMWFVQPEAMHLLTSESDMSTYVFNKHLIKHRFCPACGMHPYAEGTAPSGQAMVAINLRCIEGIDLDALPVKHFDGRAL